MAHVIIDAIRNEAGEIRGFAKVTQDVTGRRESQIALEKAREALFQSQKMEAIGQLVGGLAHDFNNLLMAVLGTLELLRKRLPDDPRSIALLDNAVQGAKRGATLTQRMLAFAHRQELKQEVVDLHNLIQGMLGLLERSLGKQIEIQTVFPLKPMTDLSDPNQLELAILNLAVNARDAMPEGGTITVAAREQFVQPNKLGDLPAGRYVCLSIVDKGEGMDQKTLQRATEPFFTTKGTGKGLASVCRWSTVSPSNPAAISRLKAQRASAPLSNSGCLLPRSTNSLRCRPNSSKRWHQALRGLSRFSRSMTTV
jgi:signal transduction histidine kinase